jgi:hypothetical protein
MSRWVIIPVILVALLVPLSFAAACEDACYSDYNNSVNSAKAVSDSKSYYCGISETNCWSREGLPPGTPDPCWSMCGQANFSNDAFQSCCYQSSKMNADGTLSQCLANCGPAVPTQQPTSNATVTYNVEISSTGSIFITDLYGNPVTKLANTPVSMKTGGDGNLYLVFKTPSGDKEVQLHLEPDSDFRLDATGACSTSGAGLSPKPSGTVSLIATGQPPGLEETWGCFSSEHGSIRGTINGGGDFIKGSASKIMSFAAAGSNPVNDITPDAVSVPSDYGRLDVNESVAPGEPGFELKVSLPDGNIFVNSTGGHAEYSAEPLEGGVALNVSSGSIIVTSDQLPGATVTIGEGQAAFLMASDISGLAVPNPLMNPAANGTGNQNVGPITQPVTPGCTSSFQCPSMQVCQNGTCTSPSCLPTSFVIAFALLGAIFFKSHW